MTEVDSLMGGADRKLIDPQASSQFLFEYDGSFDMSGDMCIYFSLPDSMVIYVYKEVDRQNIYQPRGRNFQLFKYLFRSWQNSNILNE
jgi:hypothetical protein